MDDPNEEEEPEYDEAEEMDRMDRWGTPLKDMIDRIGVKVIHQDKEIERLKLDVRELRKKCGVIPY